MGMVCGVNRSCTQLFKGYWANILNIQHILVGGELRGLHTCGGDGARPSAVYAIHRRCHAAGLRCEPIGRPAQLFVGRDRSS